MEPGRKIEPHACDPCTSLLSLDTRSPIEGRSDIDFAKACSSLPESHAIAVAMGVGALMAVGGIWHIFPNHYL